MGKITFIRSGILLSAIFALLSAVNAHANQWQVFGISKTTDSSIFCSATLVKKGSSCFLLTAAHCLDNQAQKITLRSHTKAVVTQADVMTIDRSKDLAWIQPNPNTLKNLCSQIQEVGKEKMFGRENYFARYLSYGVLNSGLYQIDISKNKTSASPLKTRSVIHGHPGLRFTVALSPISLVKGMSGGVLTDDFGNFLGINSQYEPAVDASHFIPVEEVLEYLSAPSDLRTLSVQGINRFQDSGGNNHGNSGGGNNHGNGTDNSKARSWQDSIKEMDEGVILPDGRVLIGRGGYSVDGLDKWAMTQNMKNQVYREADGYPNETIRRDILKRLNGLFRSQAVSVNAKVLDILPTDPFVRSTEFNMNHNLNIQIDSSKIKMNFPFGLDLKSKPVSAEWRAQFSSDSKQITLSNAQSTLVCKNNNYLKLICRSENEELSISYPDSHMKLEFRWYKKINPQQVLFMHGVLYEAR